jgi:hypothetical protein
VQLGVKAEKTWRIAGFLQILVGAFIYLICLILDRGRFWHRE